jgi:hypothetical protein
MIDAVLSDELQTSVCLVPLENSHCSLWQWNSQIQILGILELDLVLSFQVVYRVSSNIYIDQMVLSDWNIVNFWNELDLLLG